MILQHQSFTVNEFKIPEFTLQKGEMIRFWVEIIPKSTNDSDGYWGAKKIQETINSFKPMGIRIKISPKKVDKSFLDVFKPITAGDYLRKNFDFLSYEDIESLLFQVGIQPGYKIKDLGIAHQKVFAIICEFQKEQVVSYDYYGLSPNTEEQLTEFVKKELKKGKSAISFDNLHYKPDKVDSDRIINLEIRRENQN